MKYYIEAVETYVFCSFVFFTYLKEYLKKILKT